MDKTTYQIADKTDSKKLTEFLCREGQFLLPIVELIAGAYVVVDELIDVAGRAAVEAVLTLWAQEVAGPKHPGKAAGEIGWYGRQPTTIPLTERKLRVQKPRLRRKGPGADKEASAAQIKGKLTALRAAQVNANQELTKARQNLRQILTLRQEATLVLNGLLD